ncbi:MAG: hypothetical protein HDT38_02410 [Clostridiales bacterium]|nr:hypothetical protein [Clostridiales bacterium]
MPTSIVDILKIIVNDVLPAIGNLCLFFISVYTFRLTIFPKKLRFIGYKPCLSMFEGDAVEITLENRALSPVVIEAVSVVLNGYNIKIFSEEDDGPCIIDGFKTGKIKMIPFSSIYCEEGEISFGIDKDIYLIVDTPRGKQYLNYAGDPKKYFLRFREKFNPVKHATVKRNYFNGKILKPYVRYAILYADRQKNTHTVFVLPSGVMSEMLFGYNGLTEDIALSKETMCAHFEKEFSKVNLLFAIKEFTNTDSLIIDYD